MGVVTLRGLCGAVLAVVVGLLPVAPPEHVHETSDAHGHHHRVAHRHALSHALTHGHENGSEVTDRDPVFANEDVFIAPAPPPTLAPVRTSSALFSPSQTAGRAPRSEYVERLIHGPPRAPTALRAPPVPFPV